MIVIGVDPGTPLTIAALSPDGAVLVGVWDGEAVGTQESRSTRERGKTAKWYNSETLIAAILRPYAAVGGRAVIEAVSPMPEQGVVSQCRFVGSMYLARGITAGLGMTTRSVTPSKWKRDMGLSSDKEQSRAMALRLWPAKAELFKRKMDHDRAEAALLALWSIRNP